MDEVKGVWMEKVQNRAEGGFEVRSVHTFWGERIIDDHLHFVILGLVPRIHAGTSKAVSNGRSSPLRGGNGQAWIPGSAPSLSLRLRPGMTKVEGLCVLRGSPGTITSDRLNAVWARTSG